MNSQKIQQLIPAGMAVASLALYWTGNDNSKTILSLIIMSNIYKLLDED